ncbi:MAG: hypothetical protein IJI14_19700 [Anaerolineaceae bacterium]|nr:hypothetical protein [Anaerolineaceae bacterium]
MKKVLPFILVLILVLTGIASADAPIKVLIDITGETSFDTSVVVNSGDKVAIRLGSSDVTLNIEERQAEGMNFSFDIPLRHVDEQFGIADVKFFLLPEGETREFTAPDQSTPVLTISWESLTLPQQYQNLINDLTAFLQGSGEKSDNYSVIFSMLAGNEGAKNTGFYVADLDNNGTPEMLFGEFHPGMNAPVLYDMYTIKNDELVHVFDGWDRSRYYLCENGGIAHEGSSSAFNSFTSLNYYTDGELRLMQSIIYDSNANAEQPWFLSTASEYEVDSEAKPISESDAKYTLALYPYKQVELEAFIK